MRVGCGRACVAVVAILAQVGCAGLPPRPRPVELPTEAPVAELGGGGPWPDEKWWAQYQDATLDRLVEMGIAHGPTLAAAHARFETARQSVRVASAAAGAHVDASTDASRQRLSDTGLFSPRLLGISWYNQEDLGLQASYTFDWWGKQRDAVRAASDEARAAQAERSAAALLLAASLADAYFGWQSDQSRLALARQREAAVAREGDIAVARVRAELDPQEQLDVAAEELAAVREQIAALEGSANLRVVALAALVGKAAADLPPMAARPLPAIDARLPDDVRLDLISRRPDIVASRWRVQAAESTRASARADFFPDLSINALLGVQSVSVSSLLEYGSRVPEIGAAVHLPVFDGGRLKARYGASQAAVDSAAIAYQDAVVSATREVATQVSTLAQIAAERSQVAIERDAALNLKKSAAARVREGVGDPKTELTATESWLVQSDALAQLDVAGLSADIALKRALGGGYHAAQVAP